MANEIDSVRRHIDSTTAAVGAFQTAVILAEKEGADNVCSKVNQGFFALMHSQISQKIAAKQSRVDALLMELRSQKKRLLGIKENMERDYGRLASRYIRIFNGINKALKQRVRELDQPVFDFATRDVACGNNRNNLLVATVPVAQLENLQAAQQIMSSNLKNDSLRVIESTERFLRQMNEQKIITNQIMLRSLPCSESRRYMPVVVSESNFDASGNTTYSVNIPDTTSGAASSAVRGVMSEQSRNLPWSEDKNLSENVGNEFARMVAESNLSQRAKDMTLQLFRSSDIKTI